MASISPQRQEILRVLKAAGRRGMSPSEVARALGKRRGNIIQLMLNMYYADQVERADEFRYRLPDSAGDATVP